jgi:hypothetical protein
MNGWAFLHIQPRVRRAHLWAPSPYGAPWLVACCGTLEPWGVFRSQLATPTGKFKKCKRCIPFEVRRS